VRIVFDLSTTPVYQIDSDDHSITLKFSHQETNSFPAWSSNNSSPDVSPLTAALPAFQKPATISPALVTVAARNQIIENDRAESLYAPANVKPQAETPKVEKPKTETPPSTANEATPPSASIANDVSGLAFAEDWSAPQVWKPKNILPFPSADTKTESVTVAPSTESATAPVAEAEPKPIEEVATTTAPQENIVVEQPEVAPVVEQPQENLAVVTPEAKPLAEPILDEPTFPPMEVFDFPLQDFPATSPLTASIDESEAIVSETAKPQTTESVATPDSSVPEPAVAEVESVETSTTTNASEVESTASSS